MSFHLCSLTDINPFLPNGFFYLHSLGWSISNIKGVWLALLLSYFVEIYEINANSVDPDQMPCSAASDLGLHCLSLSHLWDARLLWVIVCSSIILVATYASCPDELIRKSIW